jgi:hypothetical protein
MVSRSGASEWQPVHFAVRQKFLIERGKRVAQYGCIGLDGAVGTIFAFLEPYLSTTVEPPQRILAPRDRNVPPAQQLEEAREAMKESAHLRSINTSHAYMYGLILQFYNMRACIRRVSFHHELDRMMTFRRFWDAPEL